MEAKPGESQVMGLFSYAKILLVEMKIKLKED